MIYGIAYLYTCTVLETFKHEILSKIVPYTYTNLRNTTTKKKLLTKSLGLTIMQYLVTRWWTLQSNIME